MVKLQYFILFASKETKFFLDFQKMSSKLRLESMDKVVKKKEFPICFRFHSKIGSLMLMDSNERSLQYINDSQFTSNRSLFNLLQKKSCGKIHVSLNIQNGIIFNLSFVIKFFIQIQLYSLFCSSASALRLQVICQM